MAKLKSQYNGTITTEERQLLCLSKEDEIRLRDTEIGEDLPDGYWWDDSCNIHNPFGHIIKQTRTVVTAETKETIQYQLERQLGGKGIPKVVKKLVDIAIGDKTTPSVSAQYCAKILEMYHGKATEAKTINNTTNITVNNVLLDLQNKMLDQMAKNKKNFIEMEN